MVELVTWLALTRFRLPTSLTIVSLAVPTRIDWTSPWMSIVAVPAAPPSMELALRTSPGGAGGSVAGWPGASDSTMFAVGAKVPETVVSV